MIMKSGEHWHCTNPACGCTVLVEINGEVNGANPRCACGGLMKKIRRKQHRREALRMEPQYVQELSLSDGREETRGDSVYQRVYVDHSRVKP
jgi:hypothetical protein